MVQSDWEISQLQNKRAHTRAHRHTPSYEHAPVEMFICGIRSKFKLLGGFLSAFPS